MSRVLLSCLLPLLLLACSHAFSPSFVRISTTQPKAVPAARLSLRHARMVTTNSGEDKQLRKDIEDVFKKPGFAKPALEENLFDPIANSGKKEVQELGDLTITETEVLKKKLMEEIDLAMKGAEYEMLEEYDRKTQDILESMKRDRDIIRKETETIQAFKDEMDRSPLWWMKRGKKAPKKAGSPGLSVALILAWTFGLAAMNELYAGVNSDEGISVIGGCKAGADTLLALLSAKIASKKPAVPDEEQ